MGNLNYIVFGGVDSRDYGIYISGEGVFNAPERDVEVVNIPGKDGDLLIDRGRFLNIEVTYPGFNFEPDLSTFAERLRAFRAALASQVGYQRLEDSFHPDEFRLASFRSGLDINPVMYNTASTFDIAFDCKPQRFLKSGEIPQTIGEWGETETVSGEIATFEAEPNTAIKSLVVDIEPIQSGSGDPSPTNVRPISGWSGVNVSHSGADQTNPTVYSIPFKDSEDNPITVYGGEIDVVSGKLIIDSAKIVFDGTLPISLVNWRPTSNGVGWAYAYIRSHNKIISNTDVPKLYSDKLQTSSYADLFDGTKNDAVGVYMNDVYGIFMKSSDTSLTTAEAINSYLSANPITVVYELATPIEIQLTPEQIETLLGVNNIWADSGEVSVEFGADPNILVNPTPFEALPLIEVVGVGSLTVGNITVTITGDSTQDIFIDSDIMEAYEDDNGAIISRNDRINLSGTDFPTLGTDTGITYTGLTSVTVTPRWWTI